MDRCSSHMLCFHLVLFSSMNKETMQPSRAFNFLTAHCFGFHVLQLYYFSLVLFCLGLLQRRRCSRSSTYRKVSSSIHGSLGKILNNYVHKTTVGIACLCRSSWWHIVPCQIGECGSCCKSAFSSRNLRKVLYRYSPFTIHLFSSTFFLATESS